ncbi:peptidylprolyl isomerase [Enterococcus sp. JM4C]|uniref:peptidylprolyl isomerase n=1 Tax=Candidatus Enterococcus huntleyi TaxID=1857217 RepID=UPI001379E542|nr:peptidylprolyl isomerase [Enterococcus sp. JM4C]KAF1299072.1 peptidylprolyl isomerase [Enterococcus sp. JM4C]
MKKKITLAIAGALSVFMLAACSNGTDKDIATMKGSTITVEDFYNEAKTQPQATSTTVLTNLILNEVLEKAYGDKVTDKKIDELYKAEEKTYGDTFESQLTQAGYTKKTYRALLRQQQLVDVALRAHVELTEADTKAAWDSFHPEVEAQIIVSSTEEDAKAIKKELDNKGDFDKIAKEKSVDTTTKDDGGKIKFDSQSTTIPQSVAAEAFALKDGEVSEPITYTNSSTGQSTFYIVKMTKNKAKGNDMKPYEKDIKEIATKTKISDQQFVLKSIGEELIKANVKIKDDAFKDILSQFTAAAETKESSTTESSSKTEESSSATEKSSSTKETETEASSSAE